MPGDCYQQRVPLYLRSYGVLLAIVVALGCGQKVPSEEAVEPKVVQDVPDAQRDTTVIVREADLELFLRVNPVPLRVGQEADLEYGIRNLGSEPRQVIAAPCRVFERGVDVSEGPVCALGSQQRTLQPGELWETRSLVSFEGPSGHHLFEIKVALDPEAWVGLELDLKP